VQNKPDGFIQNILIVFIGTTLVNVFNLLFQLLIAHRLSAIDFAAFNSLLSILIMLSSPLMTLQMAISKFTAEYNSSGQEHKVTQLLSGINKIIIIGAGFTFLFFSLSSFYILEKLKINSFLCGQFLAILLGLAWILPFVSGAIQGIEKFRWFSFTSAITGVFKIITAIIFINLGFGMKGAFGALIITNIVGIIFLYLPLKEYIRLKPATCPLDINLKGDLKEVFLYMFPVALSTFSFMSLVSIDMIMVKYYFNAQDSAVYSLAQMVGKIFLFLPGAISIVLLPRTSSLKAKKIDTRSTINKSLFYAGLLSLCAIAAYNLFPELILTILTGKSNPQTILLGRYFSVSMTFFTLVLVLCTYFISIKDLRYLKYLVICACLQLGGIVLFHQNLVQVQQILCLNAVFIFVVFLILANKPKPELIQENERNQE